MTNITIFSNQLNKLTFTVEVSGSEITNLKPRLSLMYTNKMLSFPMNHNEGTNWTVEINESLDPADNIPAKIEIIYNGHYLESDGFVVDIKGGVYAANVSNTTKPSTDDDKPTTIKSDSENNEKATIRNESKDKLIQDLLRSIDKQPLSKMRSLRSFMAN